jgi:hypothetical protein
MKQKLSPMLVFIVCAVAIVLLSSRPSKDTFDKISGCEFDLVDGKGKKRASISVEENNEVVNTPIPDKKSEFQITIDKPQTKT